jgi:hypothetical protein
MSSPIPVISRELDLTEYKGIQPGKSRRISVFPDNATSYNSSSSTADVFFSIPAVRNGFCITSASQIVFDITANATFSTDPVLSLSNGNGSSVIQALETIVQNQSVENILNYNVYANLLADLQPLGRSTTVGTIVAGSTSTLKAGIKLNGATTVDGPVVRCSLPLHSAVLGTGAEQFAPLIDGIRLRMTMAATAVGLIYGNTTAVTAAQYKISNFAIQLEVMDVDAGTMGALIQQSGGVMKQHCTAVNNYQATIQAAAANSVLIPARFSSVKALMTCFRLSANLAAPELRNVVGDRVLPQIQTYLWNVDGQNIPSVPVRVATSASFVYTGEVLSEIMKVFSASNQTAFDCVFNATQFGELTGTTGTGSFFLANNFEMQDSAGHALLSGRDLNSSNVYLNLTHYATALACVCDTFALYDVVLSYNMADGSVSMSK